MRRGLWKAETRAPARTGGQWSSVLLTLFAMPLFAVTFAAQTEQNPVAGLREHNAPGLLIVIFSPEVDSSRRAMTQGAVWKSFIAKLRKKKVENLEAVNEVAINESADRARALELASSEQHKFTIWLQFGAIKEPADSLRSNSVDSERLVAKYIVFAPASTVIVGQGEIEQERMPESRFETANNQKAIRDDRGRVINSKPAARLPDGSSSNGPQVVDVDALERVGELVSDRVVNAIKNYQQKRKP